METDLKCSARAAGTEDACWLSPHRLDAGHVKLTFLLILRGPDVRTQVICLDNFFTGSKDNIKHLIGKPNFELMRCARKGLLHYHPWSPV